MAMTAAPPCLSAMSWMETPCSSAPSRTATWAAAFPEGGFVIEPAAGTLVENIGGDELLFADGVSRNQPFLCFVTAPATDGRTGHARPARRLRPPDKPATSGIPSPPVCRSPRRRPARWPRPRSGRARSSHGSSTTRSSTTSPRAVSNNTPAAAGAPAMSARDRWNCCSPSAASSRCAICYAGSSASRTPTATGRSGSCSSTASATSGRAIRTATSSIGRCSPSPNIYQPPATPRCWMNPCRFSIRMARRRRKRPPSGSTSNARWS